MVSVESINADPSSGESGSNESSYPTYEEHMAEIGKEEKLERFQDFVDYLKYDAKIKKLLVQLAPNEMDYYRDEYNNEAVYYSDRLDRGFDTIREYLKEMMNNLYPSETIGERLDEIKNNIVSSGADMSKLSKVYKNGFTNMSEEFANKIRKEVKGYYLFFDPHSFDKDAKSINEILHLIHSSLMNDSDFIHSLPVLEQSQDGYSHLYGTQDSKNNVAIGIFDTIKNDGDYADVVSMGRKQTMLMMRGYGHALTVEINKENDGKYFVEYFIPKICNVDKVNMLPGVRKVKKENRDQSHDFTTGMFLVESENEGEVVGKVMELINAVPSDSDIIR